MSIIINNTYKMEAQETRTGISSAKLILYLAIGSICMLFAGLTSAYIVRQAEGNWLLFDIPNMFYYSTAAIVISSITLQLGVFAAKKGNKSQLNIYLLLTLSLGLLFTYLQYLGWGSLYSKGVVFTGANANASGSFLYVLTALHIAHLVGGLLYLLGLSIRTIFSKDLQKLHFKAELCSIYWHFLGLLWIYLLLFLVFIR